jgi:hypothetical protein
LINAIATAELNKVTKQHWLSLWVNRDGPLSARRIRDSINQSFIQFMGINLSISMYRHVAIAFMEKHIKTYIVDVSYHLQAGKHRLLM